MEAVRIGDLCLSYKKLRAKRKIAASTNAAILSFQ
jgi:hypothetical protein